jgi:hypothetical protein
MRQGARDVKRRVHMGAVRRPQRSETLVLGFGLMGWVAQRWSRTYDSASMRG